MRTKYKTTELKAELLTPEADCAAEANEATRLLARHALRDLPFYEMIVPDIPPDSELHLKLRCPFYSGDDPRVDPLRPVGVFILLGPFEGEHRR